VRYGGPAPPDNRPLFSFVGHAPAGNSKRDEDPRQEQGGDGGVVPSASAIRPVTRYEGTGRFVNSEGHPALQRRALSKSSEVLFALS